MCQINDVSLRNESDKPFFDFGDEVYYVYRTVNRQFVDCNFCESGFVYRSDGGKVSCPVCGGRSISKRIEEWELSDSRLVCRIVSPWYLQDSDNYRQSYYGQAFRFGYGFLNDSKDSNIPEPFVFKFKNDACEKVRLLNEN